MANVEELVQAKLKVRAFKNEVDPDGRAELCGEPVQRDEDGREFFEIPAHQMEYLKQLLPSYDFSDPFEKGAEAPPARNKGGRPRK